MAGLREQRPDSGNDRRDNLLDSLHECDTYQKLSKKRLDPNDITSIQQIEVKKSSLNDIRNFYSYLEQGYDHKHNCIDQAVHEIMDQYDKFIEAAFMVYGIDRDIDDYFTVASDGMERHQLAVEMGHTSFSDIVGIMSPDVFTERLTKYHEARKKMKCDISPGDECYYILAGDSNVNRFIITRIYDGEDGLKNKAKFFDAIYHDGRTISDGTLRLVAKTGNYYPLLNSLVSPFDEPPKEDKKDGSV